MPLTYGYSDQAIQENIAELVSSGKAPGHAHAIAYRLARKAWRRRYPDVPLPERLERRQPARARVRVRR